MGLITNEASHIHATSNVLQNCHIGCTKNSFLVHELRIANRMYFSIDLVQIKGNTEI